MKKIICMIFICLCLSSCSLIPRLTFDSKNTVPQSVNKSKVKEICKGKTVLNDAGRVISCEKGYYNYEEGYNKVERRTTLVEKIKNFINGLFGFGFWGLLLLVILVPGLAGTVIGRLIEGTIGITGKALKAIVTAIQKTRKTGKDLNDSLDAEQDVDVKKYVALLKEKENIK